MSNTKKKSGGSKKHGRSRRVKNQLMSAYVRGKISFEQYYKGLRKTF